MKRILTIQDFSCVGKCSLTVALPIISAAGVECCAVPTALLSNHTGFPSFFIHSLTERLEPIKEQLLKLGMTFDAVYTGYIASLDQMRIISDYIDAFGKGALVFVDPVMGDNGRLYSAITDDYAREMRLLCRRADIITPNLTEAYLLAGKDYCDAPSDEDIEALLRELFAFGVKFAVITGIPCGGEKLSTAGFDGEKFFRVTTPHEHLSQSGTGDIFSSALVSAIMRGRDYENALEIAVNFTYEAIRLTAADPERREYGVNFEQTLAGFADALR